MFGWKAKYMQIEAEYFKLRKIKLAQDTIIYNNEKAICEMVDIMRHEFISVYTKKD